jgi:hypothetical protein
MKPGIIVLLGSFALLSLGACMQPPAEESAVGEASDALDGMLSERATYDLYWWDMRHGIDPCDPPPDPWHPFVVYGFCPAADETP